MKLDENTEIKNRIETVRSLSEPGQGGVRHLQAVSLAQSIVYDTVGGNHPIMAALEDAVKSTDSVKILAATRGLVTLYDEGGLSSPRLAIAHEIEGDILDIAQAQVEAAERNTDATHKQLQLGIAAFLAGAALEDSLRRLCDARGIN